MATGDEKFCIFLLDSAGTSLSDKAVYSKTNLGARLLLIVSSQVTHKAKYYHAQNKESRNIPDRLNYLTKKNKLFSLFFFFLQ